MPIFPDTGFETTKHALMVLHPVFSEPSASTKCDLRRCRRLDQPANCASCDMSRSVHIPLQLTALVQGDPSSPSCRNQFYDRSISVKTSRCHRRVVMVNTRCCRGMSFILNYLLSLK